MKEMDILDEKFKIHCLSGNTKSGTKNCQTPFLLRFSPLGAQGQP